MPELAAAAAGLGVAVAVLTFAERAVPPALNRLLRRLAEREAALAAAAELGWLDLASLTALQATALVVGFLFEFALTGLPVLGLAAGLGLAGLLRARVAARGRARRAALQDAVLEAVRLLHQLLATGAAGVPQALGELAERGPLQLREHFRRIHAAAAAGRQGEAWGQARRRVAEPLFDLLAAAVALQRSGGAELGPLFAQLEESVAAAYDVQREAQALQVQARSAAAVILCLPLLFLGVLSALRSPYLDPYHDAGGQLFLALMLAVMGMSYLWMRRLLRLPEPPRLRFHD
ncbi:MAG TPA: type II secretion system F family protein [Candidatus Acidoferrales bacterium]|nr:type II secretion system F family protein [Candidatus Acidoferrales bacterium]